MVWDQLAIDKPHVAYMILGGFTALFMLCSLFVKEKLYIGEATVATVCGIIFGPYAANLFDPSSWGNVDKITLECSRIVLVVQCFAVGVELPKAYMERHWRSVFLLLVPVMTWGWLMTSLFIWWMVPPLNWLESLACAACVTATDPVLASSVVGKGKFAKRVPRHLRDLLSAESGCNDGMAFPFIYLSLYLLRYRPDTGKVAFHWICNTILYECIFGAFYGFILGYIARHAIKLAERKKLIDRESFLVFYFVLALFCAGSGSLLGMDDLLIGFSAGVGFSNDGWFTEKTEESHVSNVIDLLLNLAYFVYFGSIVPWSSYNDPSIGLYPWRLVIIALAVVFFRRIPIMLMLKPIIPDMKSWREALFAGHFGPIGVGAIFAAILARAELEGQGTEPLPESSLPGPGSPNYHLIQLIWPITTFMVVISMVVHGSSIAVFTLGKRINTLTITLSYTTNEDGPHWMNRLPRVQSLSKGSLSLRNADSTDVSSTEQLPEYPPGTLPAVGGLPGNFLRRVRDEDESTNHHRRSTSSLRPKRRRKRVSGGPVSQSAITPFRSSDVLASLPMEDSIQAVSDVEREKEAGEGQEDRDRIGHASSPGRGANGFERETELEIYQEGDKIIIEDAEGNVLRTGDIGDESLEEQLPQIRAQHERLQKGKPEEYAKAKSRPREKTESESIGDALKQGVETPYRRVVERFDSWMGPKKEPPASPSAGHNERPRFGRQSARAYQFGNTVIVEDEVGEVLKKYTIPTGAHEPEATTETPGESQLRRGLTRMSTWVGKGGDKEAEASKARSKKTKDEDGDSDDGLRFIVSSDITADVKGASDRGRRMSKKDFIKEIQKLNPRAHYDPTEEADTHRAISTVASQVTSTQEPQKLHAKAEPMRARTAEDTESEIESADRTPPADEDTDNDTPSPTDVATLSVATTNPQSAPAATRERSRRRGDSDSSSQLRQRDLASDGTERALTTRRREEPELPRHLSRRQAYTETGETPAERRRRLAALGEIEDTDDEDDDEEAELAGVPRRPRRAAVREPESDSEDDGQPRVVKGKIQFADGTHPAKRKGDMERDQLSPPVSKTLSTSSDQARRISWGGERGRDK